MDSNAQAKLITTLFVSQSIIVNYLHASMPGGADALLQNLESQAQSLAPSDPQLAAVLKLMPHFARTPAETSDLARQLIALFSAPQSPPQ